MHILAQSSSSYLVQISADMGRVLDFKQGRYFPAEPVGDILAGGTWEPFTGDVDVILHSLSHFGEY